MKYNLLDSISVFNILLDTCYKHYMLQGVRDRYRLRLLSGNWTVPDESEWNDNAILGFVMWENESYV